LSHTVSKISPLSPASFTFPSDRSPVFEVSITARELCYYVKVTVETLEEKPNDMPDPGGETYRYLRVEKEGIQDRAIEKAEIKFRVEKSWLTENNIDKVFLSKNVGGGWEELPTRELMEDDAYFYYSAATSGFSYFAIIGRRVPEPSTPQPVSTESPSIETQPETPQPMETPKPTETTAPGNSKTLPPAIPAPNPSPTETSLMEKIAPRFRVITPLLALILAYLLIRRREKSN
jgi:PGF-pre-PGF domain-containing protein